MSNFNSDDPRITAFVLGELEDHEAQELQQQMEHDEGLRTLVEQTRQLTEQLTHGFESEAFEVAGIDKLQLLGSQNDPATANETSTSKSSNDEFIEMRGRTGAWRLAGALATMAAIVAVLVTINHSNEQNLQRKVAQVKRKSLDVSSQSQSQLGTATGGDPRFDANADGAVPALEQVFSDREEFDSAIVVTSPANVASGRTSTVSPNPVTTAPSAPTVEYTLRRFSALKQRAKWGEVRARGQAPNVYFRQVPADVVQRGTQMDGLTSEFRITLEAEADAGVGPGRSGDRFEPIVENAFQPVLRQPLSTFSIDVDTASYTKVRQYLMQNGMLPRPAAVRIEELVNYFNYDYPAPGPESEDPFAAHIEVAACPWTPEHRLVRIGIKGKEFPVEDRPSSNLVFLLDVSGSMDSPNKLPLLKSSMKKLVDQLDENDRVAIVVYAGAAGQVLGSTTGDCKSTIMEALDRLKAGGSTNGGDGIRLAYQTALDHFIQGGVNRVILCTDGDFNVGTTGTDELVELAEKNAKTGVYLSVFGFGMGNHNDAMLEQISNKGNGNYGFIDTELEANRVFAEQLSSTLVTIAKDVKIQVEFNPRVVGGYRLIGYENRLLAAEDFNDDTKDAGEIGAGHTVTALYEVKLASDEAAEETPPPVRPVDELKYQRPAELTDAADEDEMLTVKLRYKQPDGDTSKLLAFTVKDEGRSLRQVTRDFQFSAAVASFGMLLRDSKFKGDASYDKVLEWAAAASDDRESYRQEFLAMVRKAKSLAIPSANADDTEPVESDTSASDANDSASEPADAAPENREALAR